MRPNLNKIKILTITTILFLFTIFINIDFSFATILSGWDDKDAYKPNPILFLHGFGAGSASSWDNVVNGTKDFKGLKNYFNKYTQVTTINQDLSLPYLERIAFNDPNGSIDTYPPGKFNLDGNSDGWADKINKRTNKLLPIYTFKNIPIPLKLILVCHSMGGLAAREYITNSKYGNADLNIDKIITIGTPHCGTTLANLKEEVVCDINKIIWEIPGVDHSDFYIKLETSDSLVQYLKGVYKIEPNGEAEKDMAIKSQFLKTLNGRDQHPNIKNYAIFGQVDSLVNWIFFNYYYLDDAYHLGDEIVPIDSQRGYDIFTDYPDSTKFRWVWNIEKAESVNSNHLDELNSEETRNRILSFLDSDNPEFEITSPDPTKTTAITQPSIHVTGKVYKEYLPADSQLIIAVAKQEDGATYPPQSSFLKPSDLWIPNNPDSPVAEFDEVVNFPGNGTYEVSCQIKNPAGVPSEIEKLKVNVGLVTGIVIHCHNPEGIEINSIQGVGQSANPDPQLPGLKVTTYDGSTFIGDGASNSATHNKPISLGQGSHIIKTVFNGTTLSQNITLSSGETKTLTFVFPRTEFNIYDYLIATSEDASISDSVYDWQESNGRDGVIFDNNRAFFYDSRHHFNVKDIIPVYTNNKFAFYSIFTFYDGRRYYAVDTFISHHFDVNSTSINWSFNSSLTHEGSNVPQLTYDHRIYGCMLNGGYDFQAGSFSNWFLQYIAVNDYPNYIGVKIESSGTENGITLIPGGASPGYNFLSFRKYYLSYYNAGSKIAITNYYPYTFNTKSGSLILNIRQGVKFSSVPYDLLKTGV